MELNLTQIKTVAPIIEMLFKRGKLGSNAILHQWFCVENGILFASNGTETISIKTGEDFEAGRGYDIDALKIGRIKYAERESEYPKPEIINFREYEKSPVIDLKVLTEISKYTSVDLTRTALQGVCLNNVSGATEMVATDGTTLLLAVLEEMDFPNCVIHINALKIAFKLCSYTKEKEVKFLYHKEGHKEIVGVCGENWQITSNRDMTPYPQYRRVIPDYNGGTWITQIDDLRTFASDLKETMSGFPKYKNNQIIICSENSNIYVPRKVKFLDGKREPSLADLGKVDYIESNFWSEVQHGEPFRVVSFNAELLLQEVMSCLKLGIDVLTLEHGLYLGATVWKSPDHEYLGLIMPLRMVSAE
jgi:hypothetical protein